MIINKKGFTIIEILVIIAVLIILIGLAIPRFRAMQDNANIAKARGELQTLQAAVESYYITPPAGTLKAFPPSTVGISFFLTGDVPLIVAAPIYDPWGAGGTTEYNYVLSANSRFYVIGCMGIDGAYTSGALGIGSGGVVTKDPDDYCVTNGNGC
ncbi:MAG: hypothetical protein WCH62_06135 [Candidatus Omnitrophota bacterium]